MYWFKAEWISSAQIVQQLFWVVTCLISCLLYLESDFLCSAQAVCVCMILFVCVCRFCYWFLSVSMLSCPGAWLQQCLLPFIPASAFITKFLLAFPSTILRLEGFQWTFISLCAVIIPPIPHPLSLPHFIKVLWGAPVTGPLGHRILFHYLSTQVIKANLLISPHFHHPLGSLGVITTLQPRPPHTSFKQTIASDYCFHT